MASASIKDWFRINDLFTRYATALDHDEVETVVDERRQPKDLLHLLFALVWVKQGGRWRLYYRQATRMRS